MVLFPAVTTVKASRTLNLTSRIISPPPQLYESCHKIISWRLKWLTDTVFLLILSDLSCITGSDEAD